jgi:hypothetical protein
MSLLKFRGKSLSGICMYENVYLYHQTTLENEISPHRCICLQEMTIRMVSREHGGEAGSDVCGLRDRFRRFDKLARGKTRVNVGRLAEKLPPCEDVMSLIKLIMLNIRLLLS